MTLARRIGKWKTVNGWIDAQEGVRTEKICKLMLASELDFTLGGKKA